MPNVGRSVVDLGCLGDHVEAIENMGVGSSLSRLGQPHTQRTACDVQGVHAEVEKHHLLRAVANSLSEALVGVDEALGDCIRSELHASAQCRRSGHARDEARSYASADGAGECIWQ